MVGAFFLLCISTAIIGTCTGAITWVAVSATRELFGTKNNGVNRNILMCNILLSSLCFGNFFMVLSTGESHLLPGDLLHHRRDQQTGGRP
jgi:hypothetical protein